MTLQRARYTPTTFPSKILSMLGLESWFSSQLAAIAASMPWPGEIDLRELVDGLGSGGDDSVRWMKGLAKAPDNARIYYPPLDYDMRTPCVISKRKGVILDSGCAPFPDGDVGCPRFHWSGSTGERVFFFDRCFGCELNGYSLEMDSGGTAYVGVDFDDDGPGMSSRNGMRRYRIHAQHDNDNYVMVRVSENARENHEYYTFEDGQLSGGAGASGPGLGTSKGIGLKIGGVGESKNHHFRGLTEINALGTGIWQVNGSFNAENISCWNNGIDARIDSATESQTIKLNSEQSRQALVSGPDTSIEIAPASRFGPQWTKPGAGYFQPGGLFSMRKAWIDDHAPAGSTLFDFSKDTRRVTLIDNRFAPNTPRAETGIDTMPLDRPLVAIQNDNVIGLPDVYVRGGRTRLERGWCGDDTVNLLELAGHALEGRPTFVGVATEFQAAPNVVATFTPTTNVG